MISAPETGGRVRRWILRSMPLSVLIQDFLKVRGLSWYEEEDFPEKAKDALESRQIIVRSGGLFLGDRRNCRAGVVLRSDDQNLIPIARIEEELYEYLIACGWKKDAFAIFRPARMDLSFTRTNGHRPLFLLFWAQERPPVERMLGGRERLPALVREKQFEIPASEKNASRSEPEKKPETPVSRTDEDARWSQHGLLRFRIAGNLRGPVFRKFFIKTSTDSLKVLAFSSNRPLKPDFLEMMFDMLGNEPDMVEAYLHQIQLMPHSEVKVCALSIDNSSGLFKSVTSGLCPYLIRANGRVIQFPDIRLLSRKKPQRARCISGRLKERDVFCLMPAEPAQSQAGMLFSDTEFLTRADQILDGLGLGRALLIRTDFSFSTLHESIG